jgi:hypothetical protein
MRIKISTTLRWPIERQISQSFAKDGVEFIINDQVDTCDAWVVYQGVYRPDSTICPPNRVIFFSYEPPAFHAYLPAFLNQFSQVVTCHKEVQHPGLVLRHQAQPWLAGLVRDAENNLHDSDIIRYNHEDFSNMRPPVKDRVASAITSRRVDVQGHRDRLAFIDTLAAELGAKLDLFGYGQLPVEDKFDALAPYSFHIVLENTCIDDYWTEKLADAYLASCIPLVWGCTNLEKYFPENSFVALDHSDADRAVRQAIAAITRGPTDMQLSAVAEARRKILEDYNLFSEIKRIASDPGAEPPQRVLLSDENLLRSGGALRSATRFVKDWIKPDDHDYYMTGGWRRKRKTTLTR